MICTKTIWLSWTCVLVKTNKKQDTWSFNCWGLLAQLQVNTTVLNVSWTVILQTTWSAKYTLIWIIYVKKVYIFYFYTIECYKVQVVKLCLWGFYVVTHVKFKNTIGRMFTEYHTTCILFCLYFFWTLKYLLVYLNFICLF